MTITLHHLSLRLQRELLLLLGRVACDSASLTGCLGACECLCSTSITWIKLAVGGYRRVRDRLLFGAILCISLAELLLSWKLITLQGRSAICSCCIGRATLSLLLEASLARFSTISLELRQLTGFENKSLLLVHSFLKWLTFFEAEELVVILDNMIAWCHYARFNITCDLWLHAYGNNNQDHECHFYRLDSQTYHYVGLESSLTRFWNRWHSQSVRDSNRASSHSCLP